MADEAKKTEQEPETNPETEQETKSEAPKETSQKGKGLFVWLILGAVILAGAGGGFSLSYFMGGSSAGDSNSPGPSANSPEQLKPGEKFAPELGVVDPATGKIIQKSWSYDKLDSIVANLDEPGVTRYVRITVILEMSSNLDPVKGETFLDEKKVVLQDWLTTYLAGLSLEDVRGSRNLNRIKMTVQEQFNQLLFGQGRGYVDKVLFKEFAVQ